MQIQKKHVIGYAATAIIALGIGGASASSSNSPTASPATTVTAPATPTITETTTMAVPGPTVTVTSPKPAKTVVVKVTPAPKVAFPGDGTFEVGVDIKPGTYVSAKPDSGNCYWARLQKNGDIIDNSNSSGQSIMTVRSSDGSVEVSGCSDWTRRR